MNKYKQHKSDYQEGIIRDFTDAMIYSQQDSLKNEKESAPYLTDNNLAVSVNQLFLGNNFVNFVYFIFIMIFKPELTHLTTH